MKQLEIIAQGPGVNSGELLCILEAFIPVSRSWIPGPRGQNTDREKMPRSLPLGSVEYNLTRRQDSDSD